MRKFSFTAILRHYWDSEGTWASYRNKLHSPDDKQDFDHRDAFEQILDGIGAQDGDEIEITVRTTGRKVPGRWMLTEPHKYTYVPPDEDEDGE